MRQTTLAERATSDAALAMCSDADAERLATRVQELARPGSDDTNFPRAEWSALVDDCTTPTALAARDYVDDPELNRLLSAVAMLKSGDDSLIDEVVNLRVVGDMDDQFVEKVRNLLYHGFHRLPDATGALLAGWVPVVYVAGEQEYGNLVEQSDSAGYYHPDERWLAIRRDTSWGDPDAWPRSKPGVQERYDRSTTLHELGHALHYMVGLQTEGAETLDNTDRESGEWVVNLRDDVVRGGWQADEFVSPMRTAYQKVEDGEYDTLHTFGSDARTIEETVAESFCTWVTSPLYLKESRPLIWEAFDALP